MHAISNHQTNPEKVDYGAGSDVVLVMMGILDDETDQQCSYGRSKAKSLRDVSGSRDGVILDYLKIRVEVGLNGRVKDS